MSSLGLVMIGVIIGARKVGINPDNIATPIAASLGDLITLSLLAGISSTLFKYIGTESLLNYWTVLTHFWHVSEWRFSCPRGGKMTTNIFFQGTLSVANWKAEMKKHSWEFSKMWPTLIVLL